MVTQFFPYETEPNLSARRQSFVSHLRWNMALGIAVILAPPIILGVLIGFSAPLSVSFAAFFVSSALSNVLLKRLRAKRVEAFRNVEKAGVEWSSDVQAAQIADWLASKGFLFNVKMSPLELEQRALAYAFYSRVALPAADVYPAVRSLAEVWENGAKTSTGYALLLSYDFMQNGVMVSAYTRKESELFATK